MVIHPCLLKDFYKSGHYKQYPEGTELVFSNLTPRKSLLPDINHAVLLGLKYFIKNYLMQSFYGFFNGPLFDKNEYKDVINEALGTNDSYEHINELRKLKYLPIEIYALPEGSVVPCGVPALVLFNTHKDFYWLPNMLETIMSCTLWGPCTSATIAREYRILLEEYAHKTSDNPGFVDYQAHDFSFRGMYGLEAAILSGAAHLQYFKGTDTIPAIVFREYWGYSNPGASSVPATEHSVMSAGGKDNELDTFKRLITDTYPTGIVSIVSDTWDLWRVVSEYLPSLKDIILKRDGKVVIRPDSGDPVSILCGDKNYMNSCIGHVKYKGLIECLWDIFGGTINSKGYKELDPHIGAIYGDSITLDRAHQICERLMSQGFSSTNIVFGIGSYTYQYNTRDTLGFAVKATYCEINGKGYAITKDPKTDNGTKKSHSGILKVIKGTDGILKVKENCTWDEFNSPDNQLKLIFSNGEYLGE